MVFSSGAASWEAKSSKAEGTLEKEKVLKCKMYVEAVDEAGRAACNFYLVLETHAKSILVTELSRTGAVSWLQNPRSLEDRNSLAKLLFQADCKENVYVQDVKKFQETLVLPPGSPFVYL